MKTFKEMTPDERIVVLARRIDRMGRRRLKIEKHVKLLGLSDAAKMALLLDARRRIDAAEDVA